MQLSRDTTLTNQQSTSPESKLTKNSRSRGSSGPRPGGEVTCGRNFFLEFSSKNAGFCAFLLRKTTWGQKPWQERVNRPSWGLKQYNLVPAKGRWCSVAGKVTVGLASHWPCVTDFSGLSTYGLTAKVREMSTPPTPTRAWSALPLLGAEYVKCRGDENSVRGLTSPTHPRRLPLDVHKHVLKFNYTCYCAVEWTTNLWNGEVLG